MAYTSPDQAIDARFSLLLSRFRRDRSGNIAVIFAIAVLPVLYAVGCAVDYSRATQLPQQIAGRERRRHRRLGRQGLARLHRRGIDDRDGSIPAGVTDATNIFNANMNGVTGFTLNSMTPP